MHPRLIEPPLGADADERPTREAVTAMWAKALKLPVPLHEYERNLRAFLRARAGLVRT